MGGVLAGLQLTEKEGQSSTNGAPQGPRLGHAAAAGEAHDALLDLDVQPATEYQNGKGYGDGPRRDVGKLRLWSVLVLSALVIATSAPNPRKDKM